MKNEYDTTKWIPSYMLRTSRFQKELDAVLGEPKTFKNAFKELFQMIILFYTWKI